jgi:hypothetical protein
MEEEIYTYFICDRCRSFSDHQKVWCPSCGQKLRYEKDRRSELEAKGFESTYDLAFYKREGGRFEAFIRTPKTFIGAINTEAECTLHIIVRASRKSEAIEKASKYGRINNIHALRIDDNGRGGPELT